MMNQQRFLRRELAQGDGLATSTNEGTLENVCALRQPKQSFAQPVGEKCRPLPLLPPIHLYSKLINQVTISADFSYKKGR